MFPSLVPSRLSASDFSLLLDHSKRDLAGNGGPRSVTANPGYKPHDPDHICCVREIFSFLCEYPPLPSSPLLSGLGAQLSSAPLNALLKDVALSIGLDPHRLVPHSLRFGVLAQIPDAPESDKMAQGNWSTVGGMRMYCRRSVTLARKIVTDIHSAAVCPVSHSLFMFATPVSPRV